MTYRKKLIEVSLPLEAINVASAREKSIRHGHPSTLHLWWARRPLAACRAVLFSSLVDDPSEYMPDEESARIERERLFGIIEELVVWKNSNNEEVLDKARMEIARSVARNLNVDVPVGKEAVREFLATKAPPVLDPFAGGGSIPLEAQRLGLRAYASDLNPVAVLINKALIEIPPKFANMSPIHPRESAPSEAEGQGNSVKLGRKKKAKPQDELWGKEWKGAQGLAEDVRYYGKWMSDEAFKRIGHLYPPVTITQEMLDERPDLKEQGLKAGDQMPVMAWIWARTVKCPNPACGAQMPLTRSFVLTTKKNRPAWIEPVIIKDEKVPQIKFRVRTGKGNILSGTVKRTGAQCICCETPVPFEYIRSEGKNGLIGTQMMAIVGEGSKGRIYFSPSEEHERISGKARPKDFPETNLPEKALGFRVQLYGMVHHSDLFTSRQLLAMTTLSEIVPDATKIFALHANNKSHDVLDNYIEAIAIYLAIAVSRQANRLSTICFWDTGGEKIQQVFARQAIPMTWDFVEGNPFSSSSGNFYGQVEYLASVIEFSPSETVQGSVIQNDASSSIISENGKLVVSTDPPYYDNIGYADLSDYFYIWLRSSLKNVLPTLFGTVLVPKSHELIAAPARFNDDKEKAEKFFEEGLRKTFTNIHKVQDDNYPLTVFYAFKQSESDTNNEDVDEIVNTASTGWETMLEGLIGSGFSIDGTWPIRTEFTVGLKMNANALASSIVLVCRPRQQSATTSSRREFLSALKKEIAPALRELQQGSIAPVDLAQAAIGPGMAIYSRYSAVLEADGKPMSVRTALTLINQALDEFLAEQEGEYDSDTRWALTWFDQYGHNEAAYGVAETLSRAKNTSVDGLSQAGIVEARGGKVRLYRRDELDTDWDPTQDKRLTAWESAAHLIYALENGGEESAAELLAKLGPVAEVARDLAYRLYTVCERKGWAQDALGYNMLVVAWPRLKELSVKQKSGQEQLL
jgi:putative DNA methylase